MSPHDHSFNAFRARDPNPLPEDLEKLAAKVIDALLEVHRHLGPGHLESTYEEAVCHELSLRGIPFQRQAPMLVRYKGKTVGRGFVDLLIGGQLVLELKAIELLTATHTAQAASYLAALDLQLALVANFNTPLLKDGLRRVIRSRVAP